MQDFAFRGRPVSLLVAHAPVGSRLFRFSRRSLRLALQSTARRNETDETTLTTTKTNQELKTLINGSFFTPSKILLSQPFSIVFIHHLLRPLSQNTACFAAQERL